MNDADETRSVKLAGTKRRVATLLLTLMASGLSQAAEYVESWEDRTYIKPSIYIAGACYNKAEHGYNSFEISTKYKRSGSYSLRAELHGDDKNSVCKDEYLRAEKRSRSEARLAFNHSTFKYIDHGDEIWWGTSYYFPSDEGTYSSWWTSSSRTMIAQFLGTGNSHTPELFMTIGGGGKLTFESYSSTTATGESLVRTSHSTTIQPNRWNDIVVQWRRTWQSSGFLRIWVNGTLIANKSGPVAIRDKPYATVRQGAYFGTDIRNQKYVWYIDATKIGDATSSYSSISPGSVTEAPPLPPSNILVK